MALNMLKQWVPTGWVWTCLWSWSSVCPGATGFRWRSAARWTPRWRAWASYCTAESCCSTWNWVGRFTAEYQPEAEAGLCDGQWHSVTAHKLHHRLEIIVDGRKEEAESPNARSNTADIWDRGAQAVWPDYQHFIQRLHAQSEDNIGIQSVGGSIQQGPGVQGGSTPHLPSQCSLNTDYQSLSLPEVQQQHQNTWKHNLQDCNFFLILDQRANQLYTKGLDCFLECEVYNTSEWNL